MSEIPTFIFCQIFFSEKLRKSPRISHSTRRRNISQEIKFEQGQQRYQWIENIYTRTYQQISDSHSLFTDVAGLQSEKMPKRGTQGSRQVEQHVSPDPKILLRDPIVGPCNNISDRYYSPHPFKNTLTYNDVVADVQVVGCGVSRELQGARLEASQFYSNFYGFQGNSIYRAFLFIFTLRIQS